MDIETTINTLLKDGFILVFNQDKLDIVTFISHNKGQLMSMYTIGINILNRVFLYDMIEKNKKNNRQRGKMGARICRIE